jgi:predicted double-glycine peptidase
MKITRFVCRKSLVSCLSALVLVAALLAAGCGQSQAAVLTNSIEHFIQIPLCRQATDYTCGAAALQSILYYYGDEWGESYLAEQLHSNPDWGTNYHDLISVAETEGLNAEAKAGMTVDDLKADVRAGKLVIVAFQAWSENPDSYTTDWNDGHYAVVVGYSSDRLYFMDPLQLGNYTYIPTAEFLDRWHDTDSDYITQLIHFGVIVWGDAPAYHPSEVLKLQ